MEMKYVILKSRNFLVFPPTMEHASVTTCPRDVVSAGFVNVAPHAQEDGRVEAHCFGESVSLGVRADPEGDSAILTRAFNTH